MLYLRRLEFLFCAILVIGFCVYYPGLSGDFILDDYPNIVTNKHLQLDDLSLTSFGRAAFSSDSGPLKRPLSMLSFSLNVSLTDLDPFYLKLTNVLIHLLNAILMYFFTFYLLKAFKKTRTINEDSINSVYLSVLVSAAWLLHPINLTGVLYIVQRMTSLSACFTLLGLIFYIKGRTHQLNRQPGMVYLFLCLFPFGMFSVLSKENGALIILYILLIEWIVFNFFAYSKREKYFIYAYHIIFVLVPLFTVLIFLLMNPDWLSDRYQAQNYGLLERLMTEARVLWQYINMILSADINLMGLHHDDIVLSRSLLEPITTILSLLFLIIIFAFSIYGRKKAPIVAFGVLFFIAGHSMESSFIPLVIAFDHRNYLPSYGILLILFYYLMHASLYKRTIKIRRFAAIILVGMFSVNTLVRASQWGDPLLIRFYEIEHHPDSPSANYEIAIFYAKAVNSQYIEDKEDTYVKAEKYFQRTLVLEPSNIEAMTGLIILATSNNKLAQANWFVELNRYLEKGKISSTGAASISALFECQHRNECVISNEDMQLLASSVLNNQSLKGRNAAIVYTGIGRYMTAKVGTENLVIKLGKLAIERAPDDIESRIFMANIYIIQGEFKHAREQINYAKSVNRFGMYNREISELENKL